MDFLLELRTEEIPARMQARGLAQLVERFTAGAAAAALPVGNVEGFVTPRRLVLIARDMADASTGTADERRGPRADAPAGAIAGFLKSTGLAREQLEERDTPKGRFLYATIAAPGRPASVILAELIPAIVRDFDWPKSMRWGTASVSTASPRWVRPLSGIVALLGDDVVPFEAAGVTSGRATVGHRFMSSGAIEVASAATYAGQMRAAHVMLDSGERFRVIIGGAAYEARSKGLIYVRDDALARENAGLTEWPIPLIGEFDPAFLDVPREVIQLTMRTNQKYFACLDGADDSGGALAPAFVCVANLAAADGGAAIVAGNRKVLAARLADAKFFWDADRAVTLESRLPKLNDIVFHEKLGTVADKVERVAKLARWLVESGAVPPSLRRGEGQVAPLRDQGEGTGADVPGTSPLPEPPQAWRLSPSPQRGEGAAPAVAALAALAETAARLCKADLVSATVGEFPEVQGIAGGHLATAEGLDPQIAAAIRDHYKPVGPSDEVPTAPVTVAVALADKLDTLVGFFAIDERPTGSRDPFALRRAALGVLSTTESSAIRVNVSELVTTAYSFYASWVTKGFELAILQRDEEGSTSDYRGLSERNVGVFAGSELRLFRYRKFGSPDANVSADEVSLTARFASSVTVVAILHEFLVDRLKVQQREAGIRPDVIDAVFSLGGEDDLVRLVSRAKALQAFLGTPDGGNLLAGYRRGANIVRIEEAKEPGVSDGAVEPDRLTEPAEVALNAALDAAVPEASAAVAAEDFERAMTALARLRPAVDAFFEQVTVNAHEAALRRNRLALLARLRTAVHSVADFSKLDG